MHVSSQCHLRHLEHLDPSEWSDLDDIEDVVDNELLSLLKSWSGEGKGNLGVGTLVSPSPITFLASRGMTGCLGIVRTAIYTQVFQWGGSVGIKLEGLLGQQIGMLTSQPPHLYPIIRYSLSNGPFAFLNCHRVGSEVGSFPTQVPTPMRRNAASLALSSFRSSPIECLP